jgi:hypothetical protein
MRTIIIGLAAVAAFGVGSVSFPTSARAQPAGSYAATCRDVRVSGRTMTAQCLDARGRLRSTSLGYNTCQGDIANVNGVLNCAGGRGGAYYPQGGAVGRTPQGYPNNGYPNNGAPNNGGYRGQGYNGGR